MLRFNSLGQNSAISIHDPGLIHQLVSEDFVKPNPCLLRSFFKPMGGAQARTIGLTHLDLFHRVGGFSSAVGRQGWDPEKTFAAVLMEPARANKKIRLLRIVCGKQEGLFEGNKRFPEWLDQRGIKHTFSPTEGAHQWRVWRRDLNEMVPLLFSR